MQQKTKATLPSKSSKSPSISSRLIPKKFITDKTKKLKIALFLAKMSLFGLVFAITLIFAVFAYFSYELPNPNELLERSFELSTKIFDRNGKILYEFYGDKNRTLVKFEDISPNLIHATLAAEDANFYSHQGFYLLGMLRAVKNIALGEGLQSGSTLTQQVVKNTLLSQEQTITRKAKELILSLQLENRYTKNEILQMYLNETPYGGQNYGVFTAARSYFNKSPKDLTIAEAAYIAGLPQSPSRYSYFGNTPEAGVSRKNYVLQLMHERGWQGEDGNKYFLSTEDYEAAKNEQLAFQDADVPLNAPHFVFYVKSVLADMFGEDYVDQAGLQVTTTLDLDLQNKAQQIVFDQVEKEKNYNVGNGALVALDSKTSQVLAMVGSKGFFLNSEPADCISGITGEDSCTFEPQVNVATSLRQPGSAIKPVTYATMLEKGYTSAFPFLDVPTKFPGAKVDEPYEPVNYDGTFRGPMSLRKSLANSLNIPAVKALQIVGVDTMIDQAEKMGITSFTDRSRYGLAITLGGAETSLLQLTGAYTVFASKGMYREPTPILEVKDSSGNTLYKWTDAGGKRALSDGVAFLISDILSDNGARSDAFGPSSLLNIPGHQVAVKTGTTNDKRDNYAVGYTPSLVVGTWVGNNNNEPLNQYISSGITGATPIWHNFFVEYLKDKEEEKFESPENVQKIKVDRLTGGLPTGEEATREEWFVKGTEPTSVSDWYQKIEICKIDGRIANNECRDADETEVKTFIKIKPEVSLWQTYVDSWLKENFSGDDKYFPPQMVSKLEFDGNEVSNKDDVNVSIVGVENGDDVPLDFRINVEISAYNDIERIKIYMDGNEVATDKSAPYGYNFTFNKNQLGNHTFKVEAEDDDGNEGSDSVDLNIKGWVLE